MLTTALALILASHATPAPPVDPDDPLAGRLEVPSFTVAAGERVLFDGDLTIVSDGDIVVDGELIGVDERLSDRATVDAGTLRLVSSTQVIVRGRVATADGRHGSFGAAGLSRLGALPPAWVPDDEADALLREALLASPESAPSAEAFRGGDGGDIVMECRVVFVEGRVEAGHGGDGGPGGRGGDGGDVLVQAPSLTSVSDADHDVVAGRGGQGGDGLAIPGLGRGGDGGRGGSAVSSPTIPQSVADWLTMDVGYASSTGTAGAPGCDVMGNDGGDGGDGADGVDCANPHGNDGGDGSPGGNGVATDGLTGGAGRSGDCGERPTAGKDGGKGGNGGKGTGGPGGNGGAGGNGFSDGQCCGSGGNGGAGKDGGNGTGGDAGNGGPGGSGCPPGSGGMGGRGGVGHKGSAGSGGPGGIGPGSCLDGVTGEDGNDGSANNGSNQSAGADGLPCPEGCP